MSLPRGRFELGDAYCASTADNVSRILSNVDVDVDVDGSRARGDSLAASSDDGTRRCKPRALNHEPHTQYSTLNPKPQTLNPKPQTLHTMYFKL